MKRPKWEVADVLQHVCSSSVLTSLPPTVRKAAIDIMRCRSAVLGGHKLQCSKCGHIELAYNSCRNRHCPKCQWSKQLKWINKQQQSFLPVRYAHIVFTLPKELKPLAKYEPRMVYNALFAAAWKSIKSLAQDSRWLGANVGMTAVLHTWGQNLSLHPHLHCVMPVGGWIPELKRWVWPRKKNFLFPVKAISKLYRAGFISELERRMRLTNTRWDHWSTLISQIRNSGFNVHLQISYAAAEKAIKYLGRYSSRVAISNRRIRNVTSSAVQLQYKDYRDGSKSKMLILSNREFARRFLMHVLPRGFQKIRHYGFLCHRHRRNYIEDILFFFERRPQSRSNQKRTARQPSSITRPKWSCPRCKSGELRCIDVIPRARSPDAPFPSLISN